MRQKAIGACAALLVGACLSSADLSGGERACGDANLQTDSANCGACGTVCVARANAFGTCNGGLCGIACNTGFADCNTKPEDGCEVSLASDSQHCGACENDCLGGRCVNAVCQPTVLATIQGDVESMIADESSLYCGVDPGTGTNNKVIARVGKDGGPPQDIAAALAEVPEHLAVDATHVYFVERGSSISPADGAIRKVPKAGGTVALVIGAQAFSNTFSSTMDYGRGGGAIAVEGGALYWLTASTGPSGGPHMNGRLRRCSTTGTCTASDVATALRAPEVLRIDGSTAYFSAGGELISSVYQGRGLFRCPIAGCGASPIEAMAVPKSSTVAALDLDATHLYLGSTGTIAKMRKPAEEYAPLAAARGSVRGIVLSGDRVYWIDSIADALLTCPTARCDGPPTEIALGADPVAVVADNAAVYVAVSSGNASAILRIRR